MILGHENESRKLLKFWLYLQSHFQLISLRNLFTSLFFHPRLGCQGILENIRVNYLAQIDNVMVNQRADNYCSN